MWVRSRACRPLPEYRTRTPHRPRPVPPPGTPLGRRGAGGSRRRLRIADGVRGLVDQDACVCPRVRSTMHPDARRGRIGWMPDRVTRLVEGGPMDPGDELV